VTGAPAHATPNGPVAGLLLPVDGAPRVIPVAADIAPGSWRWPVRWMDTVDGYRVVWCGERRHVRDLPANTFAWVLAARLGCPDLADRIGLSGDLLVAGVNLTGRAADVPDVVVQAAYRAGLLDQPAPYPAGLGRRAGLSVAWVGRA
jgi:hypothetical protein